MRRYTSITDVPNIQQLLQSAKDLKANPLAYNNLGKNKTLVLLFFNPSLRTRLSTQKAAYNLGMNVISMNAAQGWKFEFDDNIVMNTDKAEHIKEAAAVISQYADIIGVRTFPTLTDREKEFQINDLIKTRQRFDSLLDKEKFDAMRADGKFRLSHSGFLAALFIHLYRDEPMLYIGFRFLTLLVDIDGLFTTWRQRHAVMVQRMLGTKIGTGGSSGHDYLSATTQQNRVFIDLYNISTFIIPREDLPELPEDLRQDLRNAFRGNGPE